MSGQLYTMTLQGIKPATCTRPNVIEAMRRTTRATGIVGFSLQQVDPREGKAIFKGLFGGNTDASTRIEPYKNRLSEELGLLSATAEEPPQRATPNNLRQLRQRGT